MRKSSKCSYKIGVNEKKKERFLRPEQAIALADFLNSKPNIIKKYIAYKCTTCYFFHVGRSWEDKNMATDIFNSSGNAGRPLDLKVVGHISTYDKTEQPSIIVEEHVGELPVIMEHSDEIVAEDELMIAPIAEVVKKEEDFDWESDKRIIKWKK